MKKTDLEKLKGKKITGSGFGHADRYGKGSGEANDRRAQREHDRELGLIPFACKLQGDLVAEIRAAAEKKGVGLNEITAELLRKGLDKK
ncbi:MAG TPA: hypothetical protein VFV90_06580 [Usitatibacter sp.]|nr:hypothetical protein [Usitatibacter sp.]